MARSRAAPAPARSASSAAARPRPAASSSSATTAALPRPAAPQQQAAPAAASSGWGAKPAAPPPAPAAASAAPPALSQGGGGGGIFSGLMGSVVTGMAMGTGSAVAHRAVDSMMGPRETRVVHEHEQAPAPAAPMAASPMTDDGPCGQRVKEFADCMSRSNGDMAACSFYFDAMQSCKTQYRV